MRTIKILFGCLAFLAFGLQLCAQITEPTHCTVYGYHKLKPGMREDFLKLAKAWKKIVAYKKKNGMQDDWAISRVVIPAGTDAEYDYVTRHSFVGEAQLAGYLGKPFLPENWQSLVTLDEIKLVLWKKTSGNPSTMRG